MLKTILKSIARFLAGMPKLITEKFWDGARWVTRLVAAPAPAIVDEPEPVAQSAEDGDLQHVRALRTVASHLAANSMPPTDAVERLRESDLEWLTALSRPMLCRIAVASDLALAAHIRRQRPMAGMLAVDPAAVADFKAAARQQRERRIDEDGPEFVAA